jgi:hypothetical protein
MCIKSEASKIVWKVRRLTIIGLIAIINPTHGISADTGINLTYNGSITVTAKQLIASATPPADPVWSGPNPNQSTFFSGDTVTGRLNLPFTGVPYAVVVCGAPTNAGTLPADVSTIITTNNINAQTMINNSGNGICSIGISIAIPANYTDASISWTTTLSISYL